MFPKRPRSNRGLTAVLIGVFAGYAVLGFLLWLQNAYLMVLIMSICALGLALSVGDRRGRRGACAATAADDAPAE